MLGAQPLGMVATFLDLIRKDTGLGLPWSRGGKNSTRAMLPAIGMIAVNTQSYRLQRLLEFIHFVCLGLTKQGLVGVDLLPRHACRFTYVEGVAKWE